MTEENNSKVDKLQDTLNSRTRYHDPLGDRSGIKSSDPLSGGSDEVSEKWSSPELNEILTRERAPQEITPFMKKFFLFAMLFFVATILVGGLIFLRGSNFVSSKNVGISVVGPVTASAGEIIELGVTIENDNNTDLESVNFSVQYPQGAKDATDIANSLTFSKDEVGVIGAGDEEVRNVRLALVGATGEVKQFKFSVEYKIKGSNAIFYKDKIYEITIGTAPVSISIESPPSVTSGDTFTTTVRLSHSSADLLKNVMLRAEYPYGYSVISTSPVAIAENNIWDLGDFAPGTEKTIEIRGRLVGENQDERTFRFYAGVSDNGSFSPDFKSIIVSTQDTIAIERPSLGLNVNFNGESTPVYIAPAGRNITTTIRFQNNLPERVVNPRLELTLSKSAVDESSIQAHNSGNYNASTGRIVWNLTNNLGKSELLPGESGTVSLNFASKEEENLSPGQRDILLELALTGTPVSTGNRAVTVSETRTVKVASQVTLSSKAFYSIGPFRNSGPLPPKVGSETTYTVVWNVGNTQADIINAQITARLGSGVKWLDANSIANENISYNEETNTVTWDLKDLSSGSGFSSSGREVAFQLVLAPTAIQVGSAPALVTGISFTGKDSVSGDAVNVSNAAVTTRLSFDPAFIQGDDVVQR
ncbi:MAG: hypothetical protein NUV78_02220 [Candidatus Zambryskibacteria bacterium]|nr:hypothetical protein [Candidatus Zambryskibacteria bacterium]